MQMIHSFSDRVRQVLQNSRLEAVRLGTDYISIEHLLLAIFMDKESNCGVFFSKLNCVQNLKDKIESFIKELEAGNSLPEAFLSRLVS